MELFAVWIVEYSVTIAVVSLELTYVNLAARPHVCSMSLLLAIDEVTEVNPAIRPLEQPLALHAVIQKVALVYFLAGSDSSAKPVDLALFKRAFKNRVIRVYFESNSIWPG